MNIFFEVAMEEKGVACKNADDFQIMELILRKRCSTRLNINVAFKIRSDMHKLNTLKIEPD